MRATDGRKTPQITLAEANAATASHAPLVSPYAPKLHSRARTHMRDGGAPASIIVFRRFQEQC
jgi:hypothetical protein